MAKTKRRGTIEELRARTDARREAGRERDAARYRLAAELADLARFSIPEDAYELGSPFLRFALSQDVVGPVAAYLGVEDVGRDSGPLTVLDAARSEAFAGKIAYDSSAEYRIADETVNADVREEDLIRFEGPAGTIDFVDTSRCLHYGSRVDLGAPGRRVFFAKYVAPYASKFKRDHREEAAFRQLASGSSSELESFVLGAA